MKVAVVLFNLGGPDSPAAVRPFLRNLFSDPAIITAPAPIRWLLAHWISIRRAPVARAIYQHLGGKSPIVELTQDQAYGLEQRLAGGEDQVKVFISMRYWHPMSDQTVQEVADFGPDRVVLLPLYPQFSTTTTGSSLADWKRVASKAGLDAASVEICCYPDAPGFIGAIVELMQPALAAAQGVGSPRVLFSAHGLPKKIVDGGDPYPQHVEITAAAIVKELDRADLDWVVCYQSRVGPLEWIGPSTEDEIARAAKDGVPIVIVPIAFVSEHSETLVELDIEYRDLATSLGVTGYHRVPAVGTQPLFIEALENMVVRGLESIKAGDKGKTFTISCGLGCGGCVSNAAPCPLGKRN